MATIYFATVSSRCHGRIDEAQRSKQSAKSKKPIAPYIQRLTPLVAERTLAARTKLSLVVIGADIHSISRPDAGDGGQSTNKCGGTSSKWIGAKGIWLCNFLPVRWI